MLKISAIKYKEKKPEAALLQQAQQSARVTACRSFLYAGKMVHAVFPAFCFEKIQEPKDPAGKYEQLGTKSNRSPLLF